MEPQTRPGRLAALGAYVAVFGLVAHRWIASSATATSAGWDTRDARLIPWILAWIVHALTHDPTAIYDAPINYPAPLQLTGSEHFASSALLFAPVFWATGNALLAANAVALLSYPLAAFAMERLVAAFGLWRGAGWVAGLVFALGPLRVPGNLQVIQYLNLYLPLTALALHRLREAPNARRSALLACIFCAALFSSYYLAVMTCVLAGLWTLFELLQSNRRRGPFALRVVLATALPLLLLGLASRPYFDRAAAAAGSLWSPSTPDARGTFVLPALQARYVGAGPTWYVWVAALGGGLTNALVLLGAIALPRASRPARALAVIGVVIGVVGTALCLVGFRWLPPPLADALRFFRTTARFVVLVGFGQALLVAVALQAAHDHLTPRRRWAAVAMVVALVLGTRGVDLVTPDLDRIAAASDDAETYRTLGRVADRLGRGPLLELPLSSPRWTSVVENESMLGSTWHWLPLLGGYTGYEPPTRRTVHDLIGLLPDREALDDLIDMTHLRWILLHGEADWHDARGRKLLADAFDRDSELGAETRLEDFSLWRVDRRPGHPGWFAALRQAPRPGYTPLGTPLARLPDDSVASAVELVSYTSAPLALLPKATAREAIDPGPKGDQARAGAFLGLRLRATNRGSVAWPARTIDASTGLTVSFEARWDRLDAPDADGPTIGEAPLRRDLPAGESLTQVVVVATPDSAGVYRLAVRLRQHDGCKFPFPANVPWVTSLLVRAEEDASQLSLPEPPTASAP